MSICFVRINISKYKHDCCVISVTVQKIVSKLTFKNNKTSFGQLLTIFHSLSDPQDIKIKFESTAHYTLNPEFFFENATTAL